MKIIYNDIIPFKGYSAMMFFGYIFARRGCKPLSKYTINHESIHDAQAKDCNGYILYYLKYIAYWIKYGYRNNPLEQEAYDHEKNLNYLKNRPAKNWRQYEKTK